MSFHVRFFYANNEIRDYDPGFQTIADAKRFADREVAISRKFTPAEHLVRYQIIEKAVW